MNLIVNEHTEIFTKDLFGLPLDREVEFAIEFLTSLFFVIEKIKNRDIKTSAT